MSNHPHRTERKHRPRKHHGRHHDRSKKHSRNGLCNIFENENEWTLEVLAPGFEKSDFTMEVEEDVLKLTATKESTGRKFVKKEFGMNEIDRSFTLPKNAAVEKITAKLEAGILSVSIPKNEDAKPKSITIK